MLELIKYVNEMSEKFPNKSGELKKILDKCYSQIDDGSAEMYEIENCYDSIKKLTNENIS